MRRPLQNRLDLRTIFADDVGVVAARFIDVFDKEIRLIVEQTAIQRAKGAKGVRTEEGLVSQVIGHHDFGPVHHGCHHKGQLMAADRDHVTFLDQIDFVRKVSEKELSQHRLDLRVAENAGFRIAQQQAFDGCSVVRLHVGDEQVIQLPSAESVGHIFEENFIHSFVNRIKQDCFFIQKEIGVVADAFGNSVNSFEAEEAAIVGADPDQVVMDFSCAMHECSFPSAVRRTVH